MTTRTTLAFVAAILPIAAFAQTPEAAKAPKETVRKNGAVCRSFRPTGSRIAEQVCRSRVDWDRLDAEAEAERKDALARGYPR